MPSRSCAHINSKSLCPVPVTDSGSKMTADSLGTMFCRCPPALAERQRSQIGAVEPDQIEGHIGGCPPHEVVELWSTSLVDRDHLAVDYGLVDVEDGSDLLAERLETAQDVAVARDDAATALIKIAQAPKAIAFELKEPFGVIERLLSPGWDDRLYAGKGHLADMARPADFVQCPPAPRSGTCSTPAASR